MIIFKGENFSKAWVPSGMDMEWNWACTSKGWICDDLAFQWIRRVFDPATRKKANGRRRALVCDGHGSHVQPEVLRFCIDNNVSLLLLPAHSSHLCQPLDVGVFSPLKTYMGQELDEIMRYGIPNIRKFEWADCYRLARPKGLSKPNIKSGFVAAGLYPFNRRKVLVRMANFKESDLDDGVDSGPQINDAPSTPMRHPFLEVPSTPSSLDPALLHRANTALMANIEGGIFDTPTRAFIPKLVKAAEYHSAQVVLTNHESVAKDNILKKRREHATGIRSVLKGRHILTTEELYNGVKACKDATRAKQAAAVRRRSKTPLQQEQERSQPLRRSRSQCRI